MQPRLGSVKSLRRGDFMALLYFIFSMFDWFFSMIAFQLGVREGNLFLAWCHQHALFTPVKWILTFAATVLILALYPHRSARIASYLGVLLMAFITSYHIIGLNAHLHGPLSGIGF